MPVLDPERSLQFDTIAVHGGHGGDPATNARAVPIYQTTSYTFDNADHAARLFALEEFGNIYTRINNPTTDVFEQRIAKLEGGVGALATASGQAANFFAVANLARAGDHVVSSNSLYGGTYNLFATTLPKFGIDCSFADFSFPQALRCAIRENTKAIYAETLGNPKLDVLDIAQVAAIAHDFGIPLIVDNTIATPYAVRPIEHGADVVVHSATKFIGGHGTAIGGVIVDSGRFDWSASGKFPDFTQPDPSYHGVRYTDCFGAAAYIVKARVQLLRDTGAALSPFNAWLLLQGLETLGLRVQRHCENAQAVAEYLLAHPKVAAVSYPGLRRHPSHELAHRYLSGKGGAILTFQIEGGQDSAKRFIDGLQLFSLLANVGDAKSLVIHPATTTHQQLTEEQRRWNGIDGSTVRLSIGIEDRNDIIADIEQALRVA